MAAGVKQVTLAFKLPIKSGKIHWPWRIFFGSNPDLPNHTCFTKKSINTVLQPGSLTAKAPEKLPFDPIGKA